MILRKEYNLVRERRKGFNRYEIRGNTTVIFLDRRDGNILETLIDTEDLERIKSYGLKYIAGWDDVSKFYYAKCAEYLGVGKDGKPKYKIHYLHRDIMNAPKGSVVDHIDNTKSLDNRKYNLRITNQRVNSKNRNRANSNSITGVRNVNYIAKTDEYWVQFCINYERYKWKFPSNQFKEACEFAEKKRLELYGTNIEMQIKDKELGLKGY